MSSTQTTALTAPVPPDSPKTPAAQPILVVEDDADIAFTLKVRLKLNGIRAVVARDFKAALELAREEPIQAALLDINMPGGDGITLMRRLREIESFENLPVVILTASLRPGLRDQAMEAGADGYFTKPFDPVELITRLNELNRRG